MGGSDLGVELEHGQKLPLGGVDVPVIELEKAQSNVRRNTLGAQRNGLFEAVDGLRGFTLTAVDDAYVVVPSKVSGSERPRIDETGLRGFVELIEEVQLPCLAEGLHQLQAWHVGSGDEPVEAGPLLQQLVLDRLFELVQSRYRDIDQGIEGIGFLAPQSTRTGQHLNDDGRYEPTVSTPSSPEARLRAP